jgi:hypothetical protein
MHEVRVSLGWGKHVWMTAVLWSIWEEWTVLQMMTAKQFALRLARSNFNRSTYVGAL